jgi:ABC-type multidrug transport system permease subunit
VVEFDSTLPPIDFHDQIYKPHQANPYSSDTLVEVPGIVLIIFILFFRTQLTQNANCSL